LTHTQWYVSGNKGVARREDRFLEGGGVKEEEEEETKSRSRKD
jgi:hypothetical protein